MALLYLVGKDLARFFIDSKFGALLVGLLDDGIFNLAVDALVRIGGLDPDDRAPIGRAFFDLGAVRTALGEDGLVVVHVRDEDDHDGGRCVSWSGTAAAGPIVYGRHVQFVLVPVGNNQADGRELIKLGNLHK